jgi:hypothetical protein
MQNNTRFLTGNAAAGTGVAKTESRSRARENDEGGVTLESNAEGDHDADTSIYR